MNFYFFMRTKLWAHDFSFFFPRFSVRIDYCLGAEVGVRVAL